MQPVRIEIDCNGRGRTLATVRVGRIGRAGPTMELSDATVSGIAKSVLAHVSGDDAKVAAAALAELAGVPTAAAAPEPEPETKPRRRKKDDGSDSDEGDE